MMKFTGVKLPGGVELNGRQMYDDAQKGTGYAYGKKCPIRMNFHHTI
jgi:hypothetical protein